MNLEKHIRELLFEHDCVIVPGFGAFVCNYSSASIHSGKSQFQPPFKKISFNRNLKNSDGLLANQVAQSEKISYSDSNRVISEFVERLNKELHTEKRFDLENIGLFYLGEENTLLFEQEEAMNYLAESFGFSTFYSPAIKREPLAKKIEQKFKDKISIPSKENKDKVVVKRRIPVVRYIAVAASLLVIASLFFISIQTDLLKNATIANLNPFAEKPMALYHPNNPNVFPDITKDNVSNLLVSNRNDTTRYLNIMINGNIPIVVSLQEDKKEIKKENKIKNQKYALSAAEGSNHFHIIGGAFAIPENAEKFVTKLKKLGYDAVIIDKKLDMVSYGSFSTREKAMEAIAKIRAVQSDVWLMKN